MGLFDESKSGGFDFGVTPRSFGKHMHRAGLTRPERILEDRNVHELNDYVEEQTGRAFNRGVTAGALTGFLGYAFRRYR